MSILFLVFAASGCSRDASRTRIELADTPERQPAAVRAAVAVAAPLRCPPAGSPMLQASAHTGHHRITLTWNASAVSSRAEDNAAGYCLYRSPTKGAAKKNPTCAGCEQVNLTPIGGTACVDDLVQDGKAYYYVVTAISAAGRTSTASNEIFAQVPASVKSAGTPAAYPLCRASAQAAPNAATGGASRR